MGAEVQSPEGVVAMPSSVITYFSSGSAVDQDDRGRGRRRFAVVKVWKFH